jgi:hypothetical protein
MEVEPKTTSCKLYVPNLRGLANLEGFCQPKLTALN